MCLLTKINSILNQNQIYESNQQQLKIKPGPHFPRKIVLEKRGFSKLNINEPASNRVRINSLKYRVITQHRIKLEAPDNFTLKTTTRLTRISLLQFLVFDDLRLLVSGSAVSGYFRVEPRTTGSGCHNGLRYRRRLLPAGQELRKRQHFRYFQ